MFDAHHKRPLAATGERKNRVKGLAVLCPTCHRWSHAKADDRLHPLPVKDIRRALRSCRGKPPSQVDILSQPRQCLGVWKRERRHV